MIYDILYLKRAQPAAAQQNSTEEPSEILFQLSFISEPGTSPKVMAPSVARCPFSHHGWLKSIQSSLKSV